MVPIADHDARLIEEALAGGRDRRVLLEARSARWAVRRFCTGFTTTLAVFLDV